MNEPEKKTIVNKILERDIDLLLVEELWCNKDFLEIFLKETDWPSWPYDPNSIEVCQSLSTAYGETDVMAILTYPDGVKRALMIEDKIDAPTQERQSQRYTINGEKLKEEEEIDTVHTFLVAPKKYIKHHEDDENIVEFKSHITYEDLILFFKKRKDVRSAYKIELLQFAIKKQNRQSKKLVDPDVTDFWRRLREHVDHYYHELEFIDKEEQKGIKDVWVSWYSHINNKTKI